MLNRMAARRRRVASRFDPQDEVIVVHRLQKLARWCCLAFGFAILSPPPAAGFDNGLALTPPMGWNSWNKFGCNVNEAIVRRVADAMVSSGMRDAGYLYVVIDDCWHGPRDAQGNITADAERFPSGMRVLADYVHSRGLK